MFILSAHCGEGDALLCTMNDEYLFNYILDYIFETGGCDDIGVMLKENCNVSLESERVHRLRRMLVASGYVEEDNYAYGNHPHLSITEAGTKFVMEKRRQESSAPQRKAGKNTVFFRQNWKWIVEITVATVAALAAVASC